MSPSAPVPQLPVGFPHTRVFVFAPVISPRKKVSPSLRCFCVLLLQFFCCCFASSLQGELVQLTGHAFRLLLPVPHVDPQHPSLGVCEPQEHPPGCPQPCVLNVLGNSSTFLKSCALHPAWMFTGRPLEWLGGIYQVQIHLTEKQNSSVILTSCGGRVKERAREGEGELGVGGERGGRWEKGVWRSPGVGW